MSYTTWTEITRRTKELELDELVDLDAAGGVNMVDDHPKAANHTCFRGTQNPGSAIYHMHGYGDAIHGFVAFHWHFKHCVRHTTERSILEP